jgi:hypothetical protein
VVTLYGKDERGLHRVAVLVAARFVRLIGDEAFPEEGSDRM